MLAPLISCVIIIYLSLRYFSKDHYYKYNFFISISVFSGLFLLGSLYIHTRDISNIKNHLLQEEGNIEYYLTQVIEAPDTSGRYCKALSMVNRIRTDGQWHNIKAKVLLFLPKDELQTYGKTLLICGEPQKIPPPKNPDEFDYKKFMHNKGISHQHFIKKGGYIETDYGLNKKTLKGFSLSIRDHISHILNNNIRDRNTKAIMFALLTGQRDYIDEDSYITFIQTGIIHILAISGLHVGIIYMFMIFLLKPLSIKKWGSIFSYCLKISILIVFAFMTGLSPSVMRATLMFIIMIIGKMLNRNSHILNSVFSSFFLLLVFDPFKLFDVGFQLSYSAVLGIILFQPIIYQWMNFRFVITNRVWQLISVSIAAQLGTLPFSIYYFKQFPTYFLLGNIFAIPYVTVVTILGFLLILTSFFSNFSFAIVLILEFLSGLFIKLISVIKSLPLGLIKPIQIDLLQGILMIILITSIYFMLKSRNWKIILLSIGCAIGIISIDLKDKVMSSHKNYILIYNIPNISCIELVSGNTSSIVLSDLYEVNIGKINYHVMGHVIKKKRKTEFTDYSKISEQIPAKFLDGNLLICWNGKSIAFSGEGESNGRFMEYLDLIGLNIDYLVISNISQVNTGE